MTEATTVMSNRNKLLIGALVGALYVAVLAAASFFSALPASGAPDLASISDTLSNSALASVSNHTIRFTVGQTIPATGSVSIQFESGDFTFGSIAFDDVDIASTGGDYTLAAAAAAGTVGVQFYSDRLAIQLGSGVQWEAGENVTIEIGTNATFQTTGNNQITNPAAYEADSIRIDFRTYNASSTLLDSGTTFVAPIDAVTLNAVVDAYFTFKLEGVVGGVDINGGGTTASTSVANYIGFGTLTVNTETVMGSSLSVTTNAYDGFVVTLHQDLNMTSSTGADIDQFDDGSFSATPTSWSSPACTAGSENTYGHLGITTDDANLTADGYTTYGTNTWTGIPLFSQTPVEVLANTGPADGYTQNSGHALVGYQIQVCNLQEFGRYQNQVIYIATPTF